MTDIVERLREFWKDSKYGKVEPKSKNARHKECLEAAAEIERLRGERAVIVAWLRAESTRADAIEADPASGYVAGHWRTRAQAAEDAANAIARGDHLAPVGRNPEGGDPTGLRAEHEHAVPREDEAGAQPLPTPVVTTGEHR